MALAWNAGWVNALAGSNPASSAIVRRTDMHAIWLGIELVAFRLA
jgi:hypothetical protein